MPHAVAPAWSKKQVLMGCQIPRTHTTTHTQPRRGHIGKDTQRQGQNLPARGGKKIRQTWVFILDYGATTLRKSYLGLSFQTCKTRAVIVPVYLDQGWFFFTTSLWLEREVGVQRGKRTRKSVSVRRRGPQGRDSGVPAGVARLYLRGHPA